MNPAILMKIMTAWNQFQANHPKVVSYFNTVATEPMEEGTIIEISIKRPGMDAKVCNMRITQSDLSMIEDLKTINPNQMN